MFFLTGREYGSAGGNFGEDNGLTDRIGAGMKRRNLYRKMRTTWLDETCKPETGLRAVHHEAIYNEKFKKLLDSLAISAEIRKTPKSCV